MTKIYLNREQYISELHAQLSAMQNCSNKYSLEKALFDLTVLGTFYQIGSDLAHLARTNRLIEWLKQNQRQSTSDIYIEKKAAELAEDEKGDRMLSLASKACYLGSLLSLSIVPMNPVGVIGSIGSAAFFLMRAGASEGSTRPKQIEALRYRLA